MALRKIRTIPLLLATAGLLVISGGAVAALYPYRSITGMRLPVARFVNLAGMGRTCYSWPESAEDVLARAESAMPASEGWTRFGDLENPISGVEFSRVQPRSALSYLPFQSQFAPFKRSERVHILPAASSAGPNPRGSVIEVSPTRIPSTTIVVDQTYVVGFGCGMRVDPRAGLRFAPYTPRQARPR